MSILSHRDYSGSRQPGRGPHVAVPSTFLSMLETGFSVPVQVTFERKAYVQ